MKTNIFGNTKPVDKNVMTAREQEELLDFFQWFEHTDAPEPDFYREHSPEMLKAIDAGWVYDM